MNNVNFFVLIKVLVWCTKAIIKSDIKLLKPVEDLLQEASENM